MKNIILFTSLLLFSLASISQENPERYLMEADTTWYKEIFTLPTSFAREMTLNGFEEAVFPPGWGKVESPQLWSYIFVWSVSAEKMVSSQELETNLELYFDGLMDVKKDTIVPPKFPATALLVEGSSTKNSTTYLGKVRTYDRFRSQKMMTLHVIVEQQFCEAQQKAIIVFRFSPKVFNDEIWDLLKNVPFRADACKIE